MKLKVLRADPAGNITLFVLDPVPREERGPLAEKLMTRLDLGIEQVGYRCPPPPGLDGCMEMAGGEFCGNATRAWGFYIASQGGGLSRVRLQVSGMDRPVWVDVDADAGTARSEMPLPLYVRSLPSAGRNAVLVHLGGIAHLVVDTAPSMDFFLGAEPLLQQIPDLDAYGVIFLHEGRMTPLVKVPAAGSLVWEGSCGSGSLAAAVARSMSAPDGLFRLPCVQPAGTVTAEVLRENGEITAAWIGGSVSLGQPFEAEI